MVVERGTRSTNRASYLNAAIGYIANQLQDSLCDFNIPDATLDERETLLTKLQRCADKGWHVTARTVLFAYWGTHAPADVAEEGKAWLDARRKEREARRAERAPDGDYEAPRLRPAAPQVRSGLEGFALQTDAERETRNARRRRLYAERRQRERLAMRDRPESAEAAWARFSEISSDNP